MILYYNLTFAVLNKQKSGEKDEDDDLEDTGLNL
jgi:hypothetical protein